MIRMENRMWELLIGAMNGESTTVVVDRQQKRDLDNIKETKLLPIQCGRGREEEQNEYSKKLRKLGIVVVEQYDDLMMRVVLPEGWSISHDGGYWSYVLDEKGRKRASFFYKGAPWDRDAFLHFQRRFSISHWVADYNEKDFEPQPKLIQDGFEEVWVDVEDEYEKEERKECGFTKYVYEDDGSVLCEDENGTMMKLVKKPKYIPNPNYVPMHGKEEYSQPFHYEVHDHDKTVLFSSDIVRTDFEWSEDKHREFFDNREEKQKQAQEQCLHWLKEHYPNWEDVLAYWN